MLDFFARFNLIKRYGDINIIQKTIRKYFKNVKISLFKNILNPIYIIKAHDKPIIHLIIF